MIVRMTTNSPPVRHHRSTDEPVHRAIAMPASTSATAPRPCSRTPEWMGQLSGWAAGLPKPTSILIVSAHWQTAPIALSATHRVPLVYDFYGFPQHYYDLQYDAPGAPELAARVKGLMPADRAGPGTRIARPGPRGVGPAHGDVPGRGHPRPPDVDAGPRSAAPVRGRQAARSAPRRGRPDHRERVPDPRPAVHPRVLHGQAGRAPVVDRLRRVGARGTRRRRPRHALRLPGEGARACPMPIPTVEHFAPLFVTLGAVARPEDAPSFPIEGFAYGLSKRSFETR